MGVAQFSVAGDFMVAFGARPIFDELEQGAADAAVPNVFGDEPAFEVRDRSGGCAFDMIAADGKFGHADDFIVETSEGDESIGGQELLDFQSMAGRWAIGPEGVPEFGPRFGVFGGGDEDFGSEVVHCAVRIRGDMERAYGGSEEQGIKKSTIWNNQRFEWTERKESF